MAGNIGDTGKKAEMQMVLQFSDMVKHELRVTSCELRVTS